MSATDRWLRCPMCSKEFVGHYARRWCDECKPKAKKQQMGAYVAKHTPPDDEDKRKGKLKKLSLRLRELGITLDEYEITLVRQGNKCAICRRDFSTITTGSGKQDAIYKDHDHKTGQFRGLLCGKCNKGLGLLGDDIDGINNALRYLQTSWRNRSWQ